MICEYYDSAISLTSPEFDTLQGIAGKTNVFLPVGIIEKDSKGGATLLSSHRKLIPTPAERLVWGRGSGDGLKVVDIKLGKVGGLICRENYTPAARMALYQQGIEIYTAPNADDLQSWLASMRHVAKGWEAFFHQCQSVL